MTDLKTMLECLRGHLVSAHKDILIMENHIEPTVIIPRRCWCGHPAHHMMEGPPGDKSWKKKEPKVE